MGKLYKWRRGFKRVRRYQKILILLGTAVLLLVGVSVLGLTLFFVAFRSAPVDLSNVGTIGLISVVGVGAVIYWLIVGVVAWRYLKSQSVQGIMSKSAIAVPQPVAPHLNQPTVVTPAMGGRPTFTPAVLLSPSQFEQEVARVFGRRFGLQAEVVGKSNDGGIDVKLYDAHGTLVAIIQAKRYDEKKTLNPGFLRELDSCKRRMGVPRAYLVTTARFSADVRQQAQEMHIDLVDGRLFEEWRQAIHILPRRRSQTGLHR